MLNEAYALDGHGGTSKEETAMQKYKSNDDSEVLLLCPIFCNFIFILFIVVYLFLINL